MIKVTTAASFPNRLLKGMVIFAAAAVFALSVLLLCTNGYRYFHYSGRYVTMEMKTPVEGYGQAYFAIGPNYREKDSYRFRLIPTSGFEKYRIPLPETGIKSIRFDPLDKSGPFEIRSITIETRDEQIIWDGDKLTEQIVPLQQITVERFFDFIPQMIHRLY